MNALFKNIKKWFLSNNEPVQAIKDSNSLTRETCLHEAGHYLMAYMFQKNFILQFITFDKSKMDATWNGGFKFKGAPNARNTPEFNDQFALISISGICVNTISFHGAAFVMDNLFKFPNDASMLQAQGADVDYDLFRQRIFQVSTYFNLDFIRTQWNAFIYTFHFFLNKDVWQAVEGLGDLLLKSKNYTLSHEELDEFLKAQTYYPALQKLKSVIHTERYPLTKEGLLLNLP